MPLETKFIHRPLTNWNFESKKRIVRSYIELGIGIIFMIAAIFTFFTSDISLPVILLIIGISAIIKSFISRLSAKRAKGRAEESPNPRFSIHSSEEY
jgi:uncharacterized membrane protein HdeD (DUF308 family)